MKCDFEITDAGDGAHKFRCRVCHFERTVVADAYVRRCRLRGLGDAVARVTNALGVPECEGCEKRKEKLNRLVPFKSE